MKITKTLSILITVSLLGLVGCKTIEIHPHQGDGRHIDNRHDKRDQIILVQDDRHAPKKVVVGAPKPEPKKIVVAAPNKKADPKKAAPKAAPKADPKKATPAKKAPAKKAPAKKDDKKDEKKK